jgi:hypothetical protein
MRLGRPWGAALVAVLVVSGALSGCARRQQGPVNDIVPQVSFNRMRTPLGSAIEVTYTWKVEPTAKKIPADYRALVHFLDSHKVMLFEDDHAPIPPTSTWEPGKTYSYTRTKFIPIYPYVGEVEVRMGLTPPSGRGERLALKADDAGLREYRVAKMELLPQTENIFLVYKEGWHSPEASPQNPGLERTWTKKEGLVSFKNPKKDVVVYLEADTNSKVFGEKPVLTVSIGNNKGIVVPIENSELFLKKIKFSKEDLGNGEWVDLRLTMNQSFVPKALGINEDDRELGLLVYHLYVAEAEKLGTVPEGTLVAAGPVTVPTPAPSKPPVKGAPVKAAPGVKPSPQAPPAAKPSAPPAKRP